MANLSPADVLRRVDRAVWIVTARDGEQLSGCVATFVSDASIVSDMPRILLGIAKQHHTHAMIVRSGIFALHLIDESQIELAWHFGMQSGHRIDKFQDIEIEPRSSGAPILRAAVNWMQCRIETRMDIGDRTVLLAQIESAGGRNDGTILTQHRFIELTPPQRLTELKQQLERDAAVDRAAIEQWRLRCSIPPQTESQGGRIARQGDLPLEGE